MLSLKKIDIRNIVGDADNPRNINTVQYELLELSLRKFGLLSPLFITDKGLLLSGHQRTKTLRNLGQEYLYVCVIDSSRFDKSQINSLNFIFNKELQEISNVEMSNEQELQKKYREIKDYLLSLPDVDNKMQGLENIELISANELVLDKQPTDVSIANSTALYNRIRQAIPLIIDANNVIINGGSRFKVYRDRFQRIPCIRVPHVTADVFRFITANYTLKGKEDNIRVEQRRHFIAWNENSKFLKILLNIKDKIPLKILHERLYNEYPSILDFGSGNGKQSVLQRYYKGVEHILFEPFACSGTGIFSYHETYTSIKGLLDRLEDDKPFDLVRANAVLNSVPFEEDSQKVELLLKFLSAGSKSLVLSSRNKDFYLNWIKSGNSVKVKDMQGASYISSGSKTKVQRFHTADELADKFQEGGLNILKIESGYVFIRVINPLYTIDKEELLDAVRFEFGINYYGRVFEDLRERAVELFGKRYDKYVELGLVKSSDNSTDKNSKK